MANQNPIAPNLLSSAIALHREGNLNDAENLYQTLLTSDPKNVNALTLLGTIHAQKGNLEEGIRLMDKAIAIKPDHAEAYFNRALSLQTLGRYEDALASYDKATVIDPTYAEAFWHKSLILLTLGQYEEGWKLYEWRWKTSGKATARTFPKPQWLGKEPLAGKTILVHAEQGLGDTIQMCRFIPMMETLGAAVILEVDTSLVELISTITGSFNLVSKGSLLPAFDLHCPLLSLPLALGISVTSIPANIPYLFADPEKRKEWHDRLGVKMKPRIGLVCSGGMSHENDHHRSIALNLLSPLLKYDFDFHMLQKEIRSGDEMALVKHKNITSHTRDLLDFTDTAVLITEMDIVISVDTSVAHLAGALGKPVWILLPFVPDFRWMTKREDSPWYPSVRLFRQSKAGDWNRVIEKVRKEMERQKF